MGLEGVIQSHPLNSAHTVRHVPLDNEELLLNVREALPGFLLHISQRLIQIFLAPVAVNFRYYSWVPQIGDRLVDDELLRASLLKDCPHHVVHASPAIGLSSNEDWYGLLWVCLPVTSSDIEVVGAIANVTGNHHRLLFIPLPILGVWDVNGIVMATFRVIENEANRCVVSVLGFVCDPVEVNGAEGNTECIVLREWGGVDGELGRRGGLVGGVFWWGEK